MTVAATMSLAMVAMMVPTAVPFFLGYGRDARRPAATAVVAVYVAVWAGLGAAGYLVMNAVMLPAYAGIVAIGAGVAWTLTPWARRAAARCREMCRERPGGAVRVGLAYAGSCVVCSAGAMVAVMVLGMDNVAWLAAGSGAVVVCKAIGGGVRQPISEA
jgi:predicted metal-binding membrane protein